MREREGSVLGGLHSSGIKGISSRQRKEGCSAVSKAAEVRHEMRRGNGEVQGH